MKQFGKVLWYGGIAVYGITSFRKELFPYLVGFLIDRGLLAFKDGLVLIPPLVEIRYWLLAITGLLILAFPVGLVLRFKGVFYDIDPLWIYLSVFALLFLTVALFLSQPIGWFALLFFSVLALFFAFTLAIFLFPSLFKQ